jgi:hypothetical protein
MDFKRHVIITVSISLCMSLPLPLPLPLMWTGHVTWHYFDFATRDASCYYGDGSFNLGSSHSHPHPHLLLFCFCFCFRAAESSLHLRTATHGRQHNMAQAPAEKVSSVPCHLSGITRLSFSPDGA